MFEYLKGTVTAVLPNYIVVEVFGVGYQVYVANPYAFQLTEQCVYVYQAVREDAITLYGFKTLDEKQIFLKLISVTGIGPKSALSILANGDVDGLVHAIESDNVAYLTKFPGVGKKTAGQLVLDLKGKLAVYQSDAHHVEKTSVSHAILDETAAALSGLGYSDKEINRVMKLLASETLVDTQTTLGLAFKLLLNK